MYSLFFTLVILYLLSRFLYKSKIYNCDLDDTGIFCWSELIENGTKKYEGRLNQGKWLEMKSGDFIIFNCIGGSNEKRLLCKIIYFEYFDNFGEAFEYLGNSLIPAKNVEQALDAYSTYFDRKNVEKFGVVCIKIKLVEVM